MSRPAFHLALDTSGPHAVLAACSPQGQELAGWNSPCQGSASVAVPLLVEQASRDGFPLRQAALLHAGIGPGSFTGVRVGIAFLRAAGLALGVRVRGCNSGLLLAHALPAAWTSFATLHDGRRGEIIVNSFAKSPDGRPVHLGLQIIPLQALADPAHPAHPPADLVLLSSLGPDFFPPQVLAANRLLHSLPPRASGLLLDPAPAPANDAEEDLYLAPIYARPPVFVEPLTHRSL